MSERSERHNPNPQPLTPNPFLLAGGGTGGHIIPALAVARELRARGRAAFFFGTDRGMEARLVPSDGFELVSIKIGGLARVGWKQTLRTMAQLPVTTLQCYRMIGIRRVRAVFSMGGYVAGPPVMAALLRRIPVVVMEPNAVPGFTNRVIGRFVQRALVSFSETSQYFAKGRTEVTGLPVREEFFRIAPRITDGVLNILITGGSQGSRTLNNAGRQSWPLLKKAGLPVRIVHQSGPNGFEFLRDEFAASGLAGEVTPFIRDMPAAFEDADLIVCRAGAGAVSELAAAGKPSILVPFPFAAGDHQTHNARAFELGGAGTLVPDADLTGERLAELILGFAAVPSKLAAMGEAARKFARPGAAARAADVLEEVAV